MFGMTTVKSTDPVRLQYVQKMVEKSKKTEEILQSKMQSCKNQFRTLDGELALEEKLVHENASLALQIEQLKSTISKQNNEQQLRSRVIETRNKQVSEEKGQEDAKHSSLKRDLASVIEATNQTLLDNRRLQ